MFGTIIFSGIPFSDGYSDSIGNIWNIKCDVSDDEWQDKYTPSSAKVDICEVE